MEIKEFVEKFIKAEDEAWQNGNFDMLEALEDPNVVYHMKYTGQDLVGWEAHRQNIMDSRKVASQLHQEWEYLTGDGNVFALSYKASSKAATDMPEMSISSGATINVDLLFVFHLVNDKIFEAWAHGNVTIN